MKCKCKVKDSCKKNTTVMMMLGGGLIQVEVRSLGKGKYEFTDPNYIPPNYKPIERQR